MIDRVNSENVNELDKIFCDKNANSTTSDNDDSRSIPGIEDSDIGDDITNDDQKDSSSLHTSNPASTNPNLAVYSDVDHQQQQQHHHHHQQHQEVSITLFAIESSQHFDIFRRVVDHIVRLCQLYYTCNVNIKPFSSINNETLFIQMPNSNKCINTMRCISTISKQQCHTSKICHHTNCLSNTKWICKSIEITIRTINTNCKQI